MKRVLSLKNLIFVLLAVTLLAACLAYPAINGVSDAGTFGSIDVSALWYSGEGGLKLASAKDIVENWDKTKLNKKIIAVIDTGIDYKHEVFNGVLYTDGKGNAVGYDARSGKEVAVEELKDTHATKHGNAVAGVIAILIKELGLEEYIKIYPIKANSVVKGKEQDTFNVTNVVNGIKRAHALGADVINMSLGNIKSESLNWATNSLLIDTLKNVCDDMLIVAAAGNDGKDADKSDTDVFYPAGHLGVLSVMAYGRDGFYDRSNYGSVYDLAAPGEDIYTAKYADGNTYQTINGTSLASPITALACALLELRYEAQSSKVPDAAMLYRMMRHLDGRQIVRDTSADSVTCLDFNTVLTQDFSNTQFNYVDPQSIDLSHNGTAGTGDYAGYVYMHASKITPVTFVANVNPFGETDPDVNASVEWILQFDDGSEIKLGSGTSYTFDPTPEMFGDTVIYARLRFGDQVFEAKADIRVEYAPYLVGEVRVTFADRVSEGVNGAPSGGVLYTTERTLFSLTGIEYVDRSVPIKWFVDGEYVAEGVTFEYLPKSVGKHIISAQYGDMPATNTTYVFTADVKPFIARPLDLSMLIIGLAVACAVAGVFIAIAVKRKKNRGTAISED